MAKPSSDTALLLSRMSLHLLGSAGVHPAPELVSLESKAGHLSVPSCGRVNQPHPRIQRQQGQSHDHQTLVAELQEPLSDIFLLSSP